MNNDLLTSYVTNITYARTGKEVICRAANGELDMMPLEEQLTLTVYCKSLAALTRTSLWHGHQLRDYAFLAFPRTPHSLRACYVTPLAGR